MAGNQDLAPILPRTRPVASTGLRWSVGSAAVGLAPGGAAHLAVVPDRFATYGSVEKPALERDENDQLVATARRARGARPVQ